MEDLLPSDIRMFPLPVPFPCSEIIRFLSATVLFCSFIFFSPQSIQLLQRAQQAFWIMSLFSGLKGFACSSWLWRELPLCSQCQKGAGAAKHKRKDQYFKCINTGEFQMELVAAEHHWFHSKSQFRWLIFLKDQCHSWWLLKFLPSPSARGFWNELYGGSQTNSSV